MEVGDYNGGRSAGSWSYETMILCVADSAGKIIHTEEATPVCGEDFCDDCGDCLHCYVEDRCQFNYTGIHRWVQYKNV